MFKLSPHQLEVGTMYEFRVDVTDSAGYSSFATQVGTNVREESGTVGPFSTLTSKASHKIDLP